MEILYGTHNKAKLEAMDRIVRTHGINAKIFTPKDIGFDRDIIENGKTFEENSEIKARTIREFCIEKGINDKIIITDDAGLCVDAIGGEPGIYSARYAGENATQEEILNKLLTKLKPFENIEDRKCEFVCVLTALLPDGEKVVARGECKGTVDFKPARYEGLTYAPVFIPEGFSVPMSELKEEEYLHVHNHRDVAMDELIKIFKEKGIY